MSKHVDLARVIHPPRRVNVPGASPPAALGLTENQSCLEFETYVKPNHRGHIVPPGEYLVDLFIASEESRTFTFQVSIAVGPDWHEDPQKFVAIRVLDRHEVIP